VGAGSASPAEGLALQNFFYLQDGQLGAVAASLAVTLLGLELEDNDFFAFGLLNDGRADGVTGYIRGADGHTAIVGKQQNVFQTDFVIDITGDVVYFQKLPRLYPVLFAT